MGEDKSGRGAGEFKEEVIFYSHFDALCDSHFLLEKKVIPDSRVAWPIRVCPITEVG
jgi:hypothetical protein